MGILENSIWVLMRRNVKLKLKKFRTIPERKNEIFSLTKYVVQSRIWIDSYGLFGVITPHTMSIIIFFFHVTLHHHSAKCFQISDRNEKCSWYAFVVLNSIRTEQNHSSSFSTRGHDVLLCIQSCKLEEQYSITIAKLESLKSHVARILNAHK